MLTDPAIADAPSAPPRPVGDRPSWRRAGRDVAAPIGVYLAVYLLLYPSVRDGFSSRFALDAHDGYQNVWNVWWVRHSLVDLHTSPYFTHALHWPTGVTLVPQTMSPLNGLVGIVLQAVGLDLVHTVNTIVVASFVATGLTTYWLLRHLRASVSVALLGGGLFTFSSFHAAHAIGHLQLISLELLPLFVLAWLRFLDRPTHLRALASAAVLFGVILCDYYYALYCIGIATILFAAHLLARRPVRWASVATFAVAVAATTGVLFGALMVTAHRDTLLGAHHAQYYGLDPLSLAIPGGASYWNSITRGYWHRLLPISISETSVYLGSVLIVGLVLSVVLRRRLRLATSWAWWVILGVFGVLALGPRLRLDGTLHQGVPLPYAALERVVPDLKLSGMPVRMTVVVVLAAIVIVSELLTNLQSRLPRPALRVGFVALLALVSIVELYPRALPGAPTTYPAYVSALRRLPHDVGVIDTAAPSAADALYYQTGHDMPMAFGYVSRLPSAAQRRDRQIALELQRNQYADLCRRFRFQYLVTRSPRRGLRMVYESTGRDSARIYDLSDGRGCSPR
jgi:hypothetical protein